MPTAPPPPPPATPPAAPLSALPCSPPPAPPTAPHPCITISVVSHGHGPQLAPLVQDIAHYCRAWVSRIIVTCNVPEELGFDPGYWGLPLHITVNATPKGFGANHNAAFKHCTDAWFLVINPDVRLQGDALGELLAAAQEGDGLLAPVECNAAGLVLDGARPPITPLHLLTRRLMRGRKSNPSAPAAAQGPIPDPNPCPSPSPSRPLPASPPPSPQPPSKPPAPGSALECGWVKGMFMLLRAKAFEQVGGFDERYFLYCEDADLCARLWLAHWRVTLNTRVPVVHQWQRNSSKSIKHLYWHATSLLKMWLTPAFWRYWRLAHTLGTRPQAPPPSPPQSPSPESLTQSSD